MTRGLEVIQNHATIRKSKTLIINLDVFGKGKRFICTYIQRIVSL